MSSVESKPVLPYADPLVHKPLAAVGKWRKGEIFAALLAAVLVTTLYACASWSNRFVYDDHEVIENLYPIHSFGDVAQIFREPHYLDFPYYRPITRLTFAIQKTIWGNHPLPYHLFNAVLAGLVMFSAYGLLRQPAFMLTPVVALLTALWFGVHPAFSECVYPAASGRETLLPSLVMILATWAYVRGKARISSMSRPVPGPGGGRARVDPENVVSTLPTILTCNEEEGPHGGPYRFKFKVSYWLSILLFAIAVFCKEQAVVLPGIFVLADVFGITPTRPRGIKRWIIRFLPMLLILAGYFYVRHLVFTGPTLHLEIQNHPFAPLASLLYGLQSAITPFMELRYEPALDGWLNGKEMLLTAVTAGCLIGLVMLAVRSRSRVRSAALFWAGWFVLLQLPTAHILRQEAAYSERYAALSILAVGATISAVLIDRLRDPSRRTVALAGAMIWILILAGVTFLRGSYYLDDRAFSIQWRNTSPNAAGPHLGLGLMAQLQGESLVADREYKLALQADPNSVTAHNNLANLYVDGGYLNFAANHFEWLLQHNPNNVQALANYARLLSGIASEHDNDARLRDRARSMLDRALTLRPNYAFGHYVMGLWDEAFASRDDAMKEYRKALEIQPDLTDAKRRLNMRVIVPTTDTATRPGP